MKKIQKAILALSLVLSSVMTAFADIAPLPEPEPIPAPDIPVTGQKPFALILAAALVVIAVVLLIRIITNRKDK